MTESIDYNHKILVVGCGASRLSQDLYEEEFLNVTSIDLSGTVIRTMQEQYRDKFPKLEFI